MGRDHGTRERSNSRFLRRILKGVWGCALNPVNPQDGKLGADRMQQEWTGSLKENLSPKTGAYSGVDWSTLAALLLQRNGTRNRGSNIVVGLDRGFGTDM